MFELLLITCVGLRMCEYETVPLAFPTETRCAEMAALLAGMNKARYAPGTDMRYRFLCRREGGSESAWIEVWRPDPDSSARHLEASPDPRRTPVRPSTGTSRTPAG